MPRRTKAQIQADADAEREALRDREALDRFRAAERRMAKREETISKSVSGREFLARIGRI